MKLLEILIPSIIGSLTGAIIVSLTIHIYMYKRDKKIKKIGQRGKGKDQTEYIKNLKKLCIKAYGLGFIFTTPKIRACVLESMEEFLKEICEGIKKENA